MKTSAIINYLEKIMKNIPIDWLELTTHRLDIYNEELAKKEFLDGFENLYNQNITDPVSLYELPTAYDYIRLGHPLSCVLEWTIAHLYDTKAKNVISFSSRTAPIFAVLRKNLLSKKRTQIAYVDSLPNFFKSEVIKNIYGYNFEVTQVNNINDITKFDGSTIFIPKQTKIHQFEYNQYVDFVINMDENYGSIILIHGAANEEYISEIQHVRRRETIAMTPINTLGVLKAIVNPQSTTTCPKTLVEDKASTAKLITQITESPTKTLVGSSGLSIQYAIMMGLIDDAQENHPKKAIKFVVPPNCYGGTNDQARRVAACLPHVEIVDLPVDGNHNMVQSLETVLEELAQDDAIPYIIAEIPTNPRVEVPDMEQLRDVLSKKRSTASGKTALGPVFILDQTFCPHVKFLRDSGILSSVKTISYSSGSKFPSGGKCTAGYCIGNRKANDLMKKVEIHLQLCDNEATDLQYKILSEQMPSMNQRITNAYKIAREFVTYIQEVLPNAKINFVSEELAAQGFTPSVFSLDLPTKGKTPEEKEEYKRALNSKLITMMITQIPNESKYCVSYGQLKGCYWTIPATSTQGTTKEGDKDYIVRVSVSPDMDIAKHKAVFAEFLTGL